MNSTTNNQTQMLNHERQIFFKKKSIKWYGIVSRIPNTESLKIII